LGEEIKYAFNRATGLGIQKVAGAIYFNNCSTADYPPGVENLIRVEPGVWRTPYMSLSCLERYSILMEYEEIEEPPYYSGTTGTECLDGDITFHFLLNTGKNLFAATYQVEVVDAPYDYNDTPKNPFVNIDESVTTTDLDGVLNGTIQAWGNITVTGDITVTEENIDLINDLSPSEVVITVVESNDPNVSSYIEYKEISKEYSVGHVISDGLIVQNAPDCGFVQPVRLWICSTCQRALFE
jgi:hypothetical protein